MAGPGGGGGGAAYDGGYAMMTEGGQAGFYADGGAGGVRDEETQIAQVQAEIALLRGELSHKGSQKQREEVIVAMRKLLNEHFDLRTRQREQQLSRLETRLKKLRDQLKQRGDSKTDVVEVRLKEYINEAKGIGF